MILRLMLGVLAVALAGCSARGETPSPASAQLPTPTLNRPKAPSPTIHIDRGPGKPMTLTGTLGLASVEGGCAYLESQKGTRYEVVYPAGWQIDQASGTLIDPAGDVAARAGDSISVRGEIAADAASVCQIGPIFRADEVLEIQGR